MIFLDLKKAFDTVGYTELLYKLQVLGISTGVLKWFHFYLANRSHYISVDGATSKSMPVKSGVPQESVLGTLLFLVYINDVTAKVNISNILPFGDDSQCIAKVCSLDDCLSLQSDLDSVLEWTMTGTCVLTILRVST